MTESGARVAYVEKAWNRMRANCYDKFLFTFDVMLKRETARQLMDESPFLHQLNKCLLQFLKLYFAT